ncbi:hypothetical protein ACFQ3S_14290 [Mucilaginibacter terrae]|uniref:hypothetical protein n=1 Tax=Mucilaginibacter terrae TaxID=1955052 RepID=UPI003636F3C0
MKPKSKTLKIAWLLFITILLNVPAFGQANQWMPPFKYWTPISSSGWVSSCNNANTCVIPATSFTKLNNDENGLQFSINCTFDFNKKNLLFTYRSKTDVGVCNYVQIYYQSNSLIFRRYKDQSHYYDFTVQDQLFDPVKGKTWTIAVFLQAFSFG